jgi:hypothetical protein
MKTVGVVLKEPLSKFEPLKALLWNKTLRYGLL